MTGITGSALTDTTRVGEAVRRIKGHTALPVCVGFGVKTAEQAGRDRGGRRRRGGRHGHRQCDRRIASTPMAVRFPTRPPASPAWWASLPPAPARRGLQRPPERPISLLCPDQLKGRQDELDHQFCPSEDQLDARTARHAGKSLDQMSGDRRDGLPQGPGEQPLRDPLLGPSHAHRGQGAAQALLRRRDVHDCSRTPRSLPIR
jgi:hypothetical protein